MIHPCTELQFISDAIGFGVFATAFIPTGTIVYVKDALEVELTPRHPLLNTPLVREKVEKYSYTEPNGTRVISWDIAKFVNHSCNCNTISTGYGFEIAIRDIHPGEEITDDYGIFNIEKNMQCFCNTQSCRKNITSSDIDMFHKQWDQRIKQALAHFNNVPQPLLPLVESKTYGQLEQYLNTGKKYRSVFSLKYLPAESSENELIQVS